jgi:chromosome segregation ATPase
VWKAEIEEIRNENESLKKSMLWLEEREVETSKLKFKLSTKTYCLDKKASESQAEIKRLRSEIKRLGSENKNLVGNLSSVQRGKPQFQIRSI